MQDINEFNFKEAEEVLKLNKINYISRQTCDKFLLSYRIKPYLFITLEFSFYNPNFFCIVEEELLTREIKNMYYSENLVEAVNKFIKYIKNYEK